MAARNTTERSAALHRGLVKLYLKCAGTGAANITSVTYGLGITVPIVRAPTGLYTITLSDKWNYLVHAAFNVIDPTGPDDWTVNVVSETVATNKTIVIAVYKGGVAADLTSDETLTGEIVLGNSSVTPVKG